MNRYSFALVAAILLAPAPGNSQRQSSQSQPQPQITHVIELRANETLKTYCDVLIQRRQEIVSLPKILDIGTPLVTFCPRTPINVTLGTPENSANQVGRFPSNDYVNIRCPTGYDVRSELDAVNKIPAISFHCAVRPPDRGLSWLEPNLRFGQYTYEG